MSEQGFTPPPPPPPTQPAPTSNGPWWKHWWLITPAVITVVATIGAVVTRDDPNSAGTVTAPATTSQEVAGTTIPGDTTPVDTSPGVTGPGDTSETFEPVDTTQPTSADDVVAGAPEGIGGDRNSPVPAGTIADIGGGWRLQVIAVEDDATATVAGANDFNDPPPDGSRFTIVTVVLGYFGLADPVSSFEPTISAVASANTGLDSSCGVIPNELPVFEDLFSGGVLTGNLCFVTTPADAGQVQLYATTGFGDTDVFLDASVTPAGVTPMTGLRGVQPGTTSAAARLAPNPLGTAVDVGDGWTMTVTGAAQDITDAVLAENQFSDPPPEGHRFVGVGVELAYSGDGSASGFDVTIGAVGDSNTASATNSCGLVPGELDQFTDVFAGGSVAGTVCFVVPAADIDTTVAYASTGFASDGSSFFAMR
jgi:hypothetical protein